MDDRVLVLYFEQIYGHSQAIINYKYAQNYSDSSCENEQPGS